MKIKKVKFIAQWTSEANECRTKNWFLFFGLI